MKRAVDCSSPIASSGSEGRQGGTGASPVRRSHRTGCLFCSLGIVLSGGAAEMYCECESGRGRREARAGQGGSRRAERSALFLLHKAVSGGGRIGGMGEVVVEEAGFSRFVPSRGQVVVVSKVKKGGSEMKQRSDDSTAGGNVGRLSEAPTPCLMKRWRRQRQVGRSRRWQRRWQKPEGEGNGLSGLSGPAGQGETGGVTRTKEGNWLRRKW